MWDEENTGTNLPAEIKIDAVDGDAYKFLFMAKGGGSANKSFLFQETKALLNPTSLLRVPRREAARCSAPSACPPYHLAVVIGGTSAEFALETAKLASARYLDTLPTAGSELGPRLPRPRARGGGPRAHPAVRHRRPVRRQVLLPRRAGDPPAAPRRLVPGRRSRCRARPTARRWPRSPPTASSSRSSSATRRSTCPRSPTTTSAATSCAIDLNRPMAEIRAELSRYPVKTRLSLTGTDGRRPRHRPRQDQGAPRRRRADAAVPARPPRVLRRARPRRPRATRRARSGRPPPGAWTPTSTSSRPPAARS